MQNSQCDFDRVFDGQVKVDPAKPGRRRRFSLAQWRAWVAEHADSEMTVAAFCQAKGLPTGRFYAWRRRLDSPVLAGPSSSGSASNADGGFVRVVSGPGSSGVPGGPGEPVGVEVRFDCGATLRCPWDRLDVIIRALSRESRG